MFFILPQSFDPLRVLPPRLWVQADECRWLVSTIVRKTVWRNTDPWGFVRLHSLVLRRVMSQRHVADIIRSLVDAGCIETAPYFVGVKTRGYRLASRYLADRHKRCRATDGRLIARIQRHAEQLKQRLYRPIHDALDALQRHLGITRKADAILDALPDHTRLCQSILVDNLRQRRLPFCVSSTGRVFNAITGLKRELRSAVTISGQPIGGVDLRCAQPALLALMIRPNSPPLGVFSAQHISTPPGAAPACPSAALFGRLAAGGDLYDFLAVRSGLDRDAVKRRVLVDVFAKRGRYPSQVERVFRSAFPSVHRFIRWVNRADHAALIRLLQRMESWLVVDKVSPRLVGRMPFVTLHDAIYSRRVDRPLVVDAFRDTFDELGFHLALGA